MISVILDEKINLKLEFNLLPDDDGYDLQIYDTYNDEREYRTVDFKLTRKDGEKFTVKNYIIGCLMPCVDVYNVSPRFMGYAHVNHHNPAEILSTATSKDFPYVMYGSRSGENRLTIGLQNQITETKMFRSGKGGYMYYDSNIIRFTRPAGNVILNTKELKDGIFISNTKKSWFDVSKDYWHYIDGSRNYIPNHTPESAFGPVWCSWLYLTDIDENIIWENALKAKDLGIKTLIIDAGWFCYDTNIPFYDSPLTNKTIGFGRFDAENSKFPNMRGLMDKIHSLGLYVWAWATPRWIFRAVETGEDAVDERLLKLRIQTEKGEKSPMLCTRCKDTWEHAAKFTSYLLEKYKFDGLLFDCWELDEEMAICTSAEHEHHTDTMGEGTMEWCKKIYESMIKTNPEAVVWFNNTTAKQYSNYSCSPNEIYCHPDENWRMSVVLKSFTGGENRIASQLCEGSFHMDEPDNNISRQMAILMMGHTPELQVDLTNLTKSQEKIIANYFKFYEENKMDLQLGHYTPFGFRHILGGPMSNMPPHVKIESESGKKAFLYIGEVRLDPIYFDGIPETIHIFNLQNINGIEIEFANLTCGDYKVTEYDCYMEEKNSKAVKIDSPAKLYLNIQSGESAKLEIW